MTIIELPYMKWIFPVFVFCYLWSCRPTAKDYIHDYYPLVYEGDLAFLKGDYEAAYKSLKKAIKNRPPINLPPYYEIDKLARSAAILKKEGEAVRYIEALIDRGYELSSFQNDSIYGNIWRHPEWKRVVEEYPSRREMYLKTVNFSLRHQIIEMKTQDQKYRASADADKYWPAQNAIDSINALKLIDIFESVGYPNIRKIGHQSVDGYFQLDIGAMLLHTADSIRTSYFIPKLRAFVEQGQCSPYDLAEVIDQYHLFNDNYQIYGTLFDQNGNITNLKYPQNVDSLRLTIGLPTLRMEEVRDSLVKKLYRIF